MEQYSLFVVFGLGLDKVVIGVYDVCLGSRIFSMHFYIRNYSPDCFKFYYLPFIISAGIWPGLATVGKRIATLAAIIEIWRKQGAKPR